MRKTRLITGLAGALVLVLASLVAAAATVTPMSSSTGERTAEPSRDPPNTSGDVSNASEAAQLLVEAMGGKQLVLLGELHGTRETPYLVGQVIQHLVAQGETLVLALEIARQEQADVDRYLDSSGDAQARAQLLSARHWQDASHDGRDSQSMLQLIERVRVMRKAHAPVQLVLVDDLEGFRSGGNRDELMARHLRAAIARNPGARMLYLAGNLHARVRPPAQKMLDRDGKPIELLPSAGQQLSDLAPWSVRIDAAQGNAWFCGHKGCGVNPLLDRGAQHSANLEWMGPQEGWDAQLLLPRFTASPPAISVIEDAN